MTSIQSVLDLDLRSGMVPNMRRDHYKTVTRLNPSSLAAGLMGSREIDPAAVKQEFEKVEKVPTTAKQDQLDRGTLAHMMLLQPERLHTDVAVWLSGRRRSGNEWDQFCDENSGKLIIKDDDYQDVAAKVNDMRRQPMVAKLLEHGTPETALLTTESVEDVVIHCKGQVDLISVPRRLIVDIKTTEAGIDYDSVRKTIRRLHYREKMATYVRWAARLTDTDIEDWRCHLLFLALGDNPGIRDEQLASIALEWGWQDRMAVCLKAVASCLSSGEWPMFQASGIVDVSQWEMPLEGEMEIDYAE